MSDHWIEDEFLRFEDFSNQEIVEVKSAIPIALEFIKLLQKDEQDFTRLFMLGKQLLPVANIVLTKLKGRFQS